MKVLVTGAAGFIGSHLVDGLCKLGMDVVGIDNLDPLVHTAKPDYLNPRADYQFIDLRSWTAESSYNDVEAIVHLAAVGGVQRAAREPVEVIDNNVVGTARLTQQASRLPNLKYFILMSSFSVYGNAYSYRLANDRIIPANRRTADLAVGRYSVYCPRTGEPAVICPVTVKTAVQPLETYAASKAMQELCLSGFKNVNSAQTIILRASSVVGSRMRWLDEEATIIARIAGWLSQGKRPVVFEDGLQCRDWIAVADVVEAIVRLLTKSEPPTLLNLCSGVPTTLLEACRQIAAVMGSDCEPEIRPQFRPGDMRDCLGDATALSSLLGRPPIAFQEAITSMFTGSDTGSGSD